MHIVHIIPGSGGSFYCENCVRDKSYLTSLKDLGYEVSIVPMYLPLFMDEQSSFYNAPVFYGAVNLYLEQQFPLYKKFPKFMHKMLNSKPVLKYAASKAGSTRAAGMEDMTISMLQGESGNQKKELEVLVNWLKETGKPDIIHISNALLLGLAKRIKEALNIPVVCNLQDEDQWLDEMDPEAAKQTWKIMAERAKDVDAFIAVSDYYAEQMKVKMQIPDDKLHSIYIGIDPTDYKSPDYQKDEQIIGYLSRLNECLGLDILVDAFIILKTDPKYSLLKLQLTGGYTGDDKKFIKEQFRKLTKAGCQNDVKIIEDFDTKERIDFLENLSVLSVPVKKGEAFGLFQMEALASGVPLVLPKLGAFPEIVDLTGGGITYQPNTGEALAEALDSLLSDKKKLETFGQNGKKYILEKLNDKKMSKELSKVYQKINT